MHRFHRVRGFALVLAIAVTGNVLARQSAAADQVGTLKVERLGTQGSPIILIPGLEGGPWVWQQTIAQLQDKHVVYG